MSLSGSPVVAAEKIVSAVIGSGSRLGHEKAAWAVDRARCELQRLHWTVQVPQGVCVQGPDLEIIGYEQSGGGYAFPISARRTVEVKLAMWKRDAWCVNRVTRKKDDYIAIVFPSGVVHFEALKDHLKLCNKSGDRYLTNLGRLFE